MRPQSYVLLGTSLLAVGLAGCASIRGGTAGVFLPTDAAQADVRPGDRVALKIWNEPAMSDTFTVAENGEVILPKLGAMRVASHSVGSLQDSVRTAYTAYLRNPSVEISVLRRVGVSGAVRQPGIFLVDLTMTLPDVIAQAGGLVEAGDPNDVIVIRDGEQLRFRAADQERFVAAELHSGDQVVIGYKSFIARNPLAVITTAVPLLGYVVTVILPALRS